MTAWTSSYFLFSSLSTTCAMGDLAVLGGFGRRRLTRSVRGPPLARNTSTIRRARVPSPGSARPGPRPRAVAFRSLAQTPRFSLTAPRAPPYRASILYANHHGWVSIGRPTEVFRGLAAAARICRARVRLAARRHGGGDLLRRPRAQDRHPRPLTKLQELEWHFHAALFSLWMGYGYTINANPRVDSFTESLSLPAQGLDRARRLRTLRAAVLRARRLPQPRFRHPILLARRAVR